MPLQKTTRDPMILKNLVGGTWLVGDSDGPPMVSQNPARPNSPVATYQRAGVGLLRQALSAAREAQPAWEAMGTIARGRVIRRAAELLTDRAEDLAELMTAEEGKTRAESRGEVDASIETLYYHAGSARASHGSTYPSGHPDELIRTVRRAVGVVAAITPWNFPLQIPVWKIAPALLCGNSVVWKPASETPAMSVALAEIFAAAGVPDGVLNLLLAPGSIGAELAASDDVDAITFTGSVPVGRSIAASALDTQAKVQLELGGHNAAIVLPDVDPAEAADALVAGAMGSTGQKCTATRRIIAVGPMYDLLIPELTSRIKALRVGDGATADTQIGPLVSSAARLSVAQALDQAVVEGAEIIAQATTSVSGEAYLTPTLLAGGPELTICREEVFGPITTLLRAENLDAAIDLANATSFGLTAAVFSSDEASIRRCVNEIDAGLVKANAPTTGSELHVPFGGLKDSSLSAPREQNHESAAEFFTWSKVAYLRTAAHWSKP